MKKKFFQLIATILMFFTGLIGFELYQNILKNEAPKIAAEEYRFDNKQPVRKRFVSFGSGCGPNGGGEGFKTEDGLTISRGYSIQKTVGKSKKELNAIIKGAKRIIEFDVKNGRFVLDISERRKSKFEIINYDGKLHNGKSCIHSITAPSLELAIEFEKWQKLQNY